MIKNKDPDIITAHKHSIRHRSEVMNSTVCGCFYCLTTFLPSEITTWTDKDESGIGQTALCPECKIDSVIGDESGFQLSLEFLKKMSDYWFQIPSNTRA